MMEAVIQILIILCNIFILNSIIKVMKIIHLQNNGNKALTDTSKFSNKKLYYIFCFAFILFSISHTIQIYGMLLEVDEYFCVDRYWLWYVRDITISISMLTMIKLIFIKLKL